jgi:hypothetical protein
MVPAAWYCVGGWSTQASAGGAPAQPDADHVVGRGGEGVTPGGEGEAARPACGEVVSAHAGDGGATTPVEVERRLAAADVGCATEGAVVEVLRQVLAGGAAGGVTGAEVADSAKSPGEGREAAEVPVGSDPNVDRIVEAGGKVGRTAYQVMVSAHGEIAEALAGTVPLEVASRQGAGKPCP